MKKIIVLLSVISAAFLLSASVFAQSAGFASESELITAARTPYDKDYVEILWSSDAVSDVGVPISSGEYLYAPVGNKVKKLSESDGTTAAAAEMDEKVSESFRGAIIGDTLVQPTRTGLCVIDTNDMSVTDFAVFGEIATDIAIYDNEVFFGVKTDGGFSFLCADMNENLRITAEYKTESALSSPALIDGFAVFSSGSRLICCSITEKTFVENEIGAVINYVYAGDYAVFMSGADGFMYKVRLLDDGRIEEDEILSCEIGGTLTAPAETENRLYVGSSEGFFIIDGLNMEIEEAYTNLGNASAPMITLGSGLRVYTAAPVESDGGKWYLYNILVTDDEYTLNEVAKIIDFEDGKTAVSDSGIMFFRDNFGQIWAISIPETSIFESVLKIIITVAIIALLVLIIRAWIKKHTANKPKF